MNNIMQLLNVTSTLPLSTTNSECTCDSNSDAFNIVMISLLNAMANKPQVLSDVNKINLYNSNQRKESDIISNTLDTTKAILNKSKIEPSSGDKDVNKRIDSAVSIASKKYGVNENLIRAIIKVESNFNPKVVSSAGAKGLMQLMPENCRDLGIKDPFNIEQNIDGGTRHIKEYLDKYNGNVEMALMAYNGGPTRMARRGVKSINDIYKMPKETQKYVPKVMKYYRV